MAAAGREDDPLLAALLGYALAGAGRRAEAAAQARWLDDLRRERFVPPEYFALIDIALGDHDRALEQLEAAAANRSNVILYLRVEPMAAPLRGDPRFRRLLPRGGRARDG